MTKEQMERHRKLVSELREVLERHHAVLDTDDSEGASEIFVAYTSDPIDQMDLYPLFEKSGDFWGGE